MESNKPPRVAGPQGTRLFSADELNQLRDQANSIEEALSDRASIQEPMLEGVGEGNQGRRYRVRPGRQTIGRRTDNDIVIDEPSVSASHAWIMNQQGHYVIMNTLSTNGTFVNGKRVHESELNHGDRIRLGSAEFVFLTSDKSLAGGGNRTLLLGLGALALAAIAAVAWWLT